MVRSEASESKFKWLASSPELNMGKLLRGRIDPWYSTESLVQSLMKRASGSSLVTMEIADMVQVYGLEDIPLGLFNGADDLVGGNP